MEQKGTDMSKTAYDLGFVNHPLSYDEVEALPFNVCLEECEGARIKGYLRFDLDELTLPDERGLAYDIEAKVLEDRADWTLEEVSYEPVFVDEDKNIVLGVTGTIFPV